MTCIVAIVDGDRLLMAGDSYIGDDNETSTCAEPKVRKYSGFLLGVCGGARACNIIEATRLPTFKGGDPYAFVRDEVVGTLGNAFRAAGNDHKDFEALVTVGGTIILIDDELGITQRTRNYDATGAGGSFAIGALAALHTLRPRSRAIKALEISSLHSPKVRPPWQIVTI